MWEHSQTDLSSTSTSTLPPTNLLYQLPHPLSTTKDLKLLRLYMNRLYHHIAIRM